MRGIVLIAAGHPMYTHYAHTLAMSIRNHSKIPIVLFHHGGGIKYLFPDQMEVFSEVFEIPEEFFMVDGKTQYIKTKVHLYDLTPFDETIFVDADTIFSPFKTIEALFDENKDCEIQFACRGDKTMEEDTKSEWVNLKEIQDKFGFDHWYELSSEVIYWKQGDVAQDVFDRAKFYYTNHGMDVKRWVGDKLEDKVNAIQEFAVGIPDEVPFSIALEQLGIKIKSPYVPSYWQPAYFNKVIPDIQIQKEHYIISAGGATVQPNIKRIYDNLAKHYSQKTKRKRPAYQLVAKQKLLPERKKI